MGNDENGEEEDDDFDYDAFWEDLTKFWHKKYDGILGKDRVDAFMDYRSIYANPLELNEKLWDPFIQIKQKGLAASKRYTPELIARSIYGGKRRDDEDRIIKKNIGKKEAERFASELAEIIYDWLNDTKSEEAETKAEEVKSKPKYLNIHSQWHPDDGEDDDEGK